MSESKQRVSVGVVGATGALGREVLGVLNSVKWRPDHVVAMASNATTIPFVTYGEQELPVEDLNLENFSSLDAVIYLRENYIHFRDIDVKVKAREADSGHMLVDMLAFSKDD